MKMIAVLPLLALVFFNGPVSAAVSASPILPTDCTTLIKIVTAASMGGAMADAEGNQLVMKDTLKLVVVGSVKEKILNPGDEGEGYDAEYTVKTKIANDREVGTFVVNFIGSGGCSLKKATLN